MPLVVGLVTIPILIKELGIDRFGVLTMAWIVIGYFSLFDLGLGRALTQIIAERLGKDAVRELPGLVWTGLSIMVVMGVIGSVIAGGGSQVMIVKVFKIPAELHIETLYAFYILSASIPIVILSSGLVGILTAYQRFDLINYVRFPLGLANYIVPLIVLNFSNSIFYITLSLALCRLVSCIAQYLLCLMIMPSLWTKKRFIAKEVKPLFHFGGWMTVSNVIGPVMVYMDRFLIGAIISVTAVAYYATPYEMVTKIWIVSGALVTTLFPAFASGSDRDAKKKVQLLSKSIDAILISIFPIVLLIVSFSKEGLKLWIGNDFANNSTGTMQWLAAGVFINCITQVLFVFVQGCGRPDLTAKYHLIEFFIYIPIIWWALHQFGIIGAAIVWTLRIVFDGVLLLSAIFFMISSASKLITKLCVQIICGSCMLICCGYPDSLTVRSILFTLSCLTFLLYVIFKLQQNKNFKIIAEVALISDKSTHIE